MILRLKNKETEKVSEMQTYVTHPQEVHDRTRSLASWQKNLVPNPPPYGLFPSQETVAQKHFLDALLCPIVCQGTCVADYNF